MATEHIEGDARLPGPTSPSGAERFFLAVLHQRVLVALMTLVAVLGGLFVAPFSWDLGVERDPVPVDAIPDIGENQQVVFTRWPGRAPEIVEDQITYPLAVALQGVPRIKTLRTQSMFGFSAVYLIFEDDADFYWTRARIAERLASLPRDLLPAGVAPQLGPDATSLGQVFWYTLEGVDDAGARVDAFGLDELRSAQDFLVRYALASVEGVAEVASIGGFVREIQVDVDPDALRAYGLRLEDVLMAASATSREVGAETTELSGVSYLLRSVGFVRAPEDVASAPVAWRDGVPVRLEDVAHVGWGPAERMGALTRSGREAVGGVVTARHGANPQAVIAGVRRAIVEMEASMPRRVLADGRQVRVQVVPFYDRSELIERTVGTLRTALTQQILITILVVLLLLMHLRSSLLISGLLPLAVLLCFIAMKATGVDANVVALAGIAIAIGTMVDIGIVITENIVQRLRQAPGGESTLQTIARATAEVWGAVTTALATTVISFLPVFALQGQEGKLFGPLAYTKTYALVASLLVALFVLPVAASWLLHQRQHALPRWSEPRTWGTAIVGGAGLWLIAQGHPLAGGLVMFWAGARVIEGGAAWQGWARRVLTPLTHLLAVAAVAGLLTTSWWPLGAHAGLPKNLLFVALLLGSTLGLFHLFLVAYPALLGLALRFKAAALSLPITLVVIGATIWLGFGQVFAWLPDPVHRSALGQWLHHEVPGLGREFLPQLDEGTFLYMPTAMPHGSIGEVLRMTQELDRLFESVPEVTVSIGKLGRAETSLDPAPISMLETIVHYEPEYKLGPSGRRLLFAVDAQGVFLRDETGALIEAPRGRPYRNWRPHIRTQQDIWDELVEAADVLGLTTAPLLQPISTRIVMLQSGIRAPMAIRLRGDDLDTLGAAALEIEALLRDHPLVSSYSVNADRPVGKPYLVVHPDREALTRYGISMATFQDTLEASVGGIQVGTTLEGRERYAIRVRYPRLLRQTPEDLAQVLLWTPDGMPVPLRDVAEVHYETGPEMIRGEDARLVSFVMFDRAAGVAEVDVIRSVEARLNHAIASGELVLAPAITWSFAGSWENTLRAEARLRVLLPLVLLLIFGLLYLQFRSVGLCLSIFGGIAVAFSGGFMLLWLYGQPWFLEVEVLGANLREVFQVRQVYLSVAVWVGFIALFGIATDDGVVMATYLRQRLPEGHGRDIAEVREAVIEAGMRRIRPCLMTTATTLLALLPVLTSYGTGADIMIPMAIPTVGGMTIALITLFVVPVLFALQEELRIRFLARSSGPHPTEAPTETEP